MIWSKTFRFALCLGLVAGPAAGAVGVGVGEVLEPVMAGEFALQAGDLPEASRHYLRAALASKDPGLAERATRIALLAGGHEQAGQALARWRALAPGSRAVEGAAVQLALARRDTDGGELAAQTLVALPDGAGLPTLLSALGDGRGEGVAVAREILGRLYAGNHMPASLGGWLAMAGLARRLEDRALGERLVAEGIERFPEDPRALLLTSARLREQGLDDAARQQLAALGDPAALAPELRRAVARQHALLGDPVAAATTLGAGPQDEDSLRQRARWLIGAGERAPLARFYAEVAGLSPSPVPERRLLLGLLAESLLRWDEAEAWYRSVPPGQGHDQALLRRAGALGRLGRLDEALDSLQALQEDPAADGEFIRDAYLLEAELLERRRRGGDALRVLDRALEVFEADPALRYARAMLHERAGRVDEALADLQLILDDDPDSYQALNAYGYALAEHRQAWAEALPYLERALALSPRSGAVLDSVGWVYYKLGQPDRALPLLRRAWKALRDPEIAAHLGEVLWESGRRAEAREVWRAGRGLDPDHAVLNRAIERALEGDDP